MLLGLPHFLIPHQLHRHPNQPWTPGIDRRSCRQSCGIAAASIQVGKFLRDLLQPAAERSQVPRRAIVDRRCEPIVQRHQQLPFVTRLNRGGNPTDKRLRRRNGLTFALFIPPVTVNASLWILR
jgi:hypothetical protein